MTTWDAIVIGAGSVGTPTACFLAEAGLKVAVFDAGASAGRGENRAAIGGIRATHSEPAKVALCRESLEVFAGWQARTGDDIGWRRGGYLFLAYDAPTEALLRQLADGHRAIGLDHRWIAADAVDALVPGIDRDGLRGGSFSPGDGSASPLRCAASFHDEAVRHGAVFHFGEPVRALQTEGGRVTGVVTDGARHHAPWTIDAAGAAAADVAALAGATLPVTTDSHEAGVSEPVARFVEPMVVDLRAAPGSKNVYFYQDAEGQLVFCITPDPPILGTDRRATSAFLPMVSQRLVTLLPRIARLRIRRTWRGLYPMTPDGSPLVGALPSHDGLIAAAGMCGQGFMLGPGIGRLLARLLTDQPTDGDRVVLDLLRPDRTFGAGEALK